MRNPLLRERNRKEGRAGLRRGRAGPYSGAGVTARVLYSRLVALWAGGEGGGAGGAGTVAMDRSSYAPRYGVGWGCAVRLRVVGWGWRGSGGAVGWDRRGGAAPWSWGGV